jgi:hypothetical protein
MRATFWPFQGDFGSNRRAFSTGLNGRDVGNLAKLVLERSWLRWRGSRNYKCSSVVEGCRLATVAVGGGSEM